MDRLAQKRLNSKRRAHRVRAIAVGAPNRPRLSINISNLHTTAQIIDDTTGRTLAYASSVGKKLSGNRTAKAEAVGIDIAAKANKAKIKQVSFDRGGRKYHGRVKALADAARAEGLEF